MNELSKAESEARTWSMVAQLAFFANFSVPFGGLVATALIYALRKDTEPIARENERNALNFEITLAILNGILIVAYVVVFFSVFVSGVALSHAGRSASHASPTLWFISVPFALMGLLFLIGVSCVVLSCVNARSAWLGRLVHYPFVIPFVRERIEAA